MLTLAPTPLGVVIYTDSKSSLQALARGGTNNRADLQHVIGLLSHRLIQLGCAVHMVWVPSHVGIRGNEMADLSAKDAAANCSICNLGRVFLEVKSRLGSAAREERALDMEALCRTHGWVYLPVGKKHFPSLPRGQSRMIVRIRTESLFHKQRLNTDVCDCGESVTLQHVLAGCARLPHCLQGLWSFQSTHRLQPQDFLKLQPALGDLPMRILGGALAEAKHLKYF